MKTSSNDLFLLVKSMTKNEKGYFIKITGKLGKDKIYVKLFKAIEKQTLLRDKYDEGGIKNILGNEAAVRQLSVYKGYLYQQVLKILSMYRESKSEKKELYEYIDNLDTLISKGLFLQANDLLMKAKKKARDSESFDILLSLLYQELIIVRRLYTSEAEKRVPAKLEERINKVCREESEVIGKIKNINHYRWLYEKAGILFSKSFFMRNKTDRLKYEAIIKEIKKTPNKLPDSTKAKSYYYSILVPYYTSLNYPKKAYYYNKLLFQTIEGSKLKTNVWRYNYLIALQNFIQSAGAIGKIKEAETYSDKLRKILYDKNYKLSGLDIFRLLGRNLTNELVIYVDWNLLDKANEKIKEIMEVLSVSLEKMRTTDRILLLYYISSYNFIIGNFEEALKWTSKIINEKEYDKMLDLFCHSRILHILSHYELKNFDLIEYILKTSKRFLKRNDGLYRIEELLFKFFEKILRTDDNHQLFLFEKLLSDLQKVFSAKKISETFMYFDFVSWTESKITNISFREILEKKAIALRQVAKTEY